MLKTLIVVAIGSASCVTTTFTGNPKVPHGAAGCRAICASYEMELAGMVALGEYAPPWRARAGPRPSP